MLSIVLAVVAGLSIMHLWTLGLEAPISAPIAPSPAKEKAKKLSPREARRQRRQRTETGEKRRWDKGLRLPR